MLLTVCIPSLYKKSKLKNRYLEGIMNSQIDSADEMSVIYDVNSEIEVMEYLQKIWMTRSQN